eukprot:1225534-Pleurochrysis_carterae.AAC.1
MSARGSAFSRCGSSPSPLGRTGRTVAPPPVLLSGPCARLSARPGVAFSLCARVGSSPVCRSRSL